MRKFIIPSLVILSFVVAAPLSSFAQKHNNGRGQGYGNNYKGHSNSRGNYGKQLQTPRQNSPGLWEQL